MNDFKMKQLLWILLMFCGLLSACTQVFAVCPNGCSCDDENLHVNCVDANLDIVPITLNPSIERLQLKGNRIRNVDSGLKFYPELNFIDLSHNHLILIQPGSFASQRKLVELYLNSNKISQLSNQTFGWVQAPLNNLAILNLQNNLIDSLEPGTFRFVENLQELDLSQNAIKNLSESVFVGLANLRILKLDNNELSEVPDVFSQKAFKGEISDASKRGTVPHLAELSLANNPIEQIRNDAFSSAKNLITLDLRGCQINTIKEHAFRGLGMLRKLILIDNNFAVIPTSSFPSLPQLETIKLGRNPFQRISKFAFGGLKKLKSVEIEGSSELSLIESEAFSNNLDLETVELSSCKKLTSLPPKLFKGLSGLKNLILKDNALQRLPEDFVSWSSLHTFHLEGNSLQCSCELLWLKEVFLQPRIQNTSSLVVCSEPQELRGKPIVDVSPADLNCYLQGPVEKTILGVSISLAVIFLVLFFFLLYKFHDKIKNTCKRGFRRPSRKNRSSVISSSAKDLDTKSSFLSQNAFPFTDEEFQLRTSLMNGSPGPNGSNYLHSSHTLNPMNSNFPYGTNGNLHHNHSLRYPLPHHPHIHHNGNNYSSPSYNEYDAPINPVNFPQFSQHQSPSHIDLPIQFPLHQQHPTLNGGKSIPTTEL